MLERSNLLDYYLDGLRTLSGAGSVTLFVPEPLSKLWQPLLLHNGELPPVPELENAKAAGAFAAAVDLDEVLDKKTPGHPILIPSSDPDSGLIPLFSDGSSSMSIPPQRERRSRRLSDAEVAEIRPSVNAWLGLRYAPDQTCVVERLGSRHLPSVVRENVDPQPWWQWIFSLGGALASFSSQITVLLKDPVTGLPGRQQFQATLVERVARCRRENVPLAVLFVNPDNFGALNDRQGRTAGDQCVKEIAEQLLILLRDSDHVARYGGVIFTALVAGVGSELVKVIASRIARDLGRTEFLDGIRLQFSIGVAQFDPNGNGDSIDALQLLQRADQALNTAKRRGGNAVVSWSANLDAEHAGCFDRLSGIFTGNMSTDYRHMAMLWESAKLISSESDFERLGAQLVKSMYAVLDLRQVGLFLIEETGDPGLLHGLTQGHRKADPAPRVEDLLWNASRRKILQESVHSRSAQHMMLPTSEPIADAKTSKALCCAIPLIGRVEPVGCLFLEASADSGPLAKSNLVFLQALGSQVAVALDRARLSELETRRQQKEQRDLLSELKVLREALEKSKLVYRSTEMERLLATARRVAATTETVLISGPTGTGKELLARTIHALSPRSDRPLVIVDCAAIPETLIESELFGHEKGAFTGATARREGRLAEAHGGTVLLDEVGELPLQVQSRLLRFAQEKQLARVGGRRVQQVDVRILAATNRDLYKEVQAGRFREDLYYRLQQLPLVVPPLRERPDDILPLAQHYLEVYRVQYQARVQRLSEHAERALLRHDWPGNVRELRNRLMKGVLLCEGEALSASDLELAAKDDPGLRNHADSELALSAPAALKLKKRSESFDTSQAPSTGFGGIPSPGSGTSLLEDLRAHLAPILRAQQKRPASELPPLGRWLQDELLRVADRVAKRNKRRGALLLGIPETTYRRRLPNVETGPEPELQRSAEWQQVRGILLRLVSENNPHHENLLVLTEHELLKEIELQLPRRMSAGAALLGVTYKTFRKRAKPLRG